MGTLLPVMVGGAIGAAGRHEVGRLMLARFGPGFPWGTLAVNLVGGLLAGLTLGVLVRTGAGETWRLLLIVGVLGGFTTFSAFSLEMWTMIEDGRIVAAAGYAATSTVGAVALAGLGLSIAKVSA